MAEWLRALRLLQRSGVWFPAPARLLTMVCNFKFRRFYSLSSSDLCGRGTMDFHLQLVSSHLISLLLPGALAVPDLSWLPSSISWKPQTGVHVF